MKIEDPIRDTVSILFGLMFPLFGIFIYTQFDYMGIKLSDIFLGFQTDSSYAMFQWLYSLFKSDMINQIAIQGARVFITQPFMSALFMWFLDGFFIGVYLKKIKKTIIISLLNSVILLLMFIVFTVLCDPTYNTMDLIFQTNLSVFLGSILTMIILVPLGSFLGYLAGRD